MGSLFETYNGAVVYQIANKFNDNIYIGSSKRFMNRKKSHLYSLKSGKHPNSKMINDYKLFGKDSFLFDIVEFVDEEDMLKIREAFWISKLNPYYNMQFPEEREIMNVSDFLNKDDGVDCILVETPNETIGAVKAKTKLSEERIRSMLQYNIFTIRQYSHLSNMMISTIMNKLKPKFSGGHILSPELDICYPFPSSKSKGQKFIIRNEKSEKYLQL